MILHVDASREENNMDKKILILGSNIQDTDDRVSKIALEAGAINHGLILDPEYVPDMSGFYHSSVADISWGGLIKLGERFDEVIMLDQPRGDWDHWKCLLGTYKVMCHLETQGKITYFRDNKNTQAFQYWQNLQKNNRSFCLYPWINKYIKDGKLWTCSRGNTPVIALSEFTSWKDDTGFMKVRDKMLAGEKLSPNCDVCYYYEENGIESYREFETLDWVAKLGLESVEDLNSIDQPYYYETLLGNKCNIKCRGCSPSRSDQIEKEFRKFNIVTPAGVEWQSSTFSLDEIRVDQLTSKHRVYFQGGEPSIMPEVVEFMRRCVDKNKLDFELTMCTNGMVLSQEFLDLLSKFGDANLSFSIDGYDRVNDYWRWGSKWKKVIENAHLIKSMGHHVSINTVPGIYNVTNLHLLFEFLDIEFPDTAVYLQINYLDSQSVFNHPMHDLVLESLERCKKTLMYLSDAKSCKTCIDSLYDYYSKNPQCDLESLREFFRFNDDLDRIRNSRLADYIPELEECRKFLK